MNRFASQKHSVAFWRGILVPLLVFALVFSLFILGVQGISRTTKAEQLEAARTALTRAAVQCYALEGRYPPDVTYLEENYGLRINHSEYIVQYNAFASNLLPQMLVLPRNFSDESAGDLP